MVCTFNSIVLSFQITQTIRRLFSLLTLWLHLVLIPAFGYVTWLMTCVSMSLTMLCLWIVKGWIQTWGLSAASRQCTVHTHYSSCFYLIKDLSVLESINNRLSKTKLKHFVSKPQQDWLTSTQLTLCENTVTLSFPKPVTVQICGYCEFHRYQHCALPLTTLSGTLYNADQHLANDFGQKITLSFHCYLPSAFSCWSDTNLYHIKTN